ncbi:aminodeoxychorismate lyase [Thalassotalea sp. PLHSN55]|uniref:aminodeoxychorismate lyase n=1 Tax=Thalassotalea sp. PLHSN55 TaxID=3435888 RepID=UPI003F8338A9
MLYCSVNFQDQQHTSAFDRGLAYGDGIFTTAKINQGKVELYHQHLTRLKNGCKRLALSNVDFGKLEQEITEVAKKFPLAVLKVLISAGQGGRGYSRIGCSEPTVIVSVHEFPSHYQLWQQQGINVGDSKTLLGLNPLLAGIKHLNRLEQVIVRQELDQREEDDLLVYDLNHQLVEATSGNVFWFKAGQLYTPRITDAGISGLQRDQILAAFPDAKQVKIEQSALDRIDAMFICNCVMGIVPVKFYNQQTLSLDLVTSVQQRLASQV